MNVRAFLCLLDVVIFNSWSRFGTFWVDMWLCLLATREEARRICFLLSYFLFATREEAWQVYFCDITNTYLIHFYILMLQAFITWLCIFSNRGEVHPFISQIIDYIFFYFWLLLFVSFLVSHLYSSFVDWSKKLRVT